MIGYSIRNDLYDLHLNILWSGAEGYDFYNNEKKSFIRKVNKKTKQQENEDKKQNEMNKKRNCKIKKLIKKN